MAFRLRPLHEDKLHFADLSNTQILILALEASQKLEWNIEGIALREDKDIDVYQNRCRDESFPGDKEMDERRLFFAFCLKPPFFFRQRAGEFFFQFVGFLCQFLRCQSRFNLFHRFL